MNDDLKGSLDAIFAQHEQTKAAKQRVREETISREASFREQFKTVCNTVVKPVMQEVGQYLGSKGYEFDIQYADEQRPANGVGQTFPAKIEMVFFFDGKRYPRHDFPHFSVIADVLSQRVSYHASTIRPGSGGQSGGDGTAKLEDVTREAVETKLLKIIKEIYR